MTEKIDVIFFLCMALGIYLAVHRGFIQTIWYLVGTIIATLVAARIAEVLHWNFYIYFLLMTVVFLLVGTMHRNRMGDSLPEKLDTILAFCFGIFAALYFCVSIMVPFTARFYGQHAKFIPGSWFGSKVVPVVERVVPYSQLFNVKNYKDMSLVSFIERMGYNVVQEGSFIRKHSERRLKPLKDGKVE